MRYATQSGRKFLIKVLLLPVVVALAITPLSAAEADMDAIIRALIARMTLQQKIGQLQLRDWGFADTAVTDKQFKQAVRDGKIGAFLNVTMNKRSPDAFNELQRIAVEESELGIPLLFGQDVIHGYKTIFPIPLGQAASWNPDLLEGAARIAAQEASSVGIRWTFAPMIDISRDARWGRIAESLGEDPYLASVLGAAMVRGFQGSDLANGDSLAACAKHFAGYGAAEGGRDYNDAYIPERLLREVYLRPFKAAIDAGAVSIMSAYNNLNDIPATGNRFLLTEVLRDEWKFDGFVVSDWNSINEMIAHGYARDNRHAAELAANAGVDLEMHTATYEQYLADLIKSGSYSVEQLDRALYRILEVKYRLGLFNNPYTEPAGRARLMNDEFLAAARQAATESLVLLKNKDNLLPLSKQAKIALIGPLADAAYEQLGTWVYDANKHDGVSVLSAIRDYKAAPRSILYTPGLSYSRSLKSDGFAEAVKIAKRSDVVLFIGGEESILSGEGHSRANIDLPGAQTALIEQLVATGKPVVLVIMAGRPIALGDTLNKVDAILMAWHPGTMGGPAIADVIFGESVPAGRLPLSWPKTSAQTPIYYNHNSTGRPPTDSNYTRMDKIAVGVFQHEPGNSSNYLDIGHKPEFPFGFGLGYGSVEYKDIDIRPESMRADESVTVSATVRNVGRREAVEIVQLYVQDVVGDVSRPVKELKGFQRIRLPAGASRRVSFRIKSSDLAFYNRHMQRVTEPGRFRVWVGSSAEAELAGEFTIR